MHFHRDVLACADTFARHVLRPTRDDVFCTSAPIGFTFGLGATLIFPFRARVTAVTLEQATPQTMFDAIDRYGVTTLFTAPTAYKAMLALGRSHRELAHLRLGGRASARRDVASMA